MAALQAALEELQAASAATTAHADALQGQVDAGLADVLAALDTKASAVDCGRKMDRAACEAMLSDLHTAVQARATGRQLKALGARVDTGDTRAALLEQKVEVALAFVEWFGDKGETYEYNASALERHMNALARGNRARVGGAAAR